MIERVDLADPESLWSLYKKDVQIEDKKVLDPFMGGGTSLVEASRFGAETVGYDLNPVAWFVSKKQLEAGKTPSEELDQAFEMVKEDVKDYILDYYRTPCPHGDHQADVMYNFWVKELDCVSCNHTVPLFKDFRIGKGRYSEDDKYNVLCPECESIIKVDDWRKKCKCSASTGDSKEKCGHEFIPEEGYAGGGDYTCPNCGQKYGILDRIQEQDGFDLRLYALEYYCPTCDEDGMAKEKAKGYKEAEQADHELFKKAQQEWQSRDELQEYIPNVDIPLGIKTDSTEFEGSITGGHNILRQGYTKWSDMYNDRQLLLLSTLLKSISNIDDENIQEYLLLAFSEHLNYGSLMSVYNPGRNLIVNIFKSNSFDPPTKPVENNVWGTEYGTGTFTDMWEMVKSGVEYAQAPTERYVEDGETNETEPFQSKIGGESSVLCGDMRTLEDENEYDAVITDPPYYDNIIYSELSDFYYVWLRILLEDEYSSFAPQKTPRADSIVANPAVQKGAPEFEDEIRQAFNTIESSLKEEGVLVFTYHHSGVESWGELLSALCDVGFEVTATYPISADANKFFEGEAVEFDIIIVARPAAERNPISWNSLRREVYRTAKKNTPASRRKS